MEQSKVILITGCSSGFGFMAAKDLARRGHIVHASMRSADGKNASAAGELRAFKDTICLAEMSELGKTLEGTMAAFQNSVFKNPDAPVDPQILVDAMIELIEMEPGQRPFRTLARLDFGVREINRLTDSYRTEALAALGLAHLDGIGSTGSKKE